MRDESLTIFIALELLILMDVVRTKGLAILIRKDTFIFFAHAMRDESLAILITFFADVMRDDRLTTLMDVVWNFAFLVFWQLAQELDNCFFRERLRLDPKRGLIELIILPQVLLAEAHVTILAIHVPTAGLLYF
mmetsp:Transcript_5975/g.16474  ORF Transcript_5975/g.16474 Transcript_5975/m.16474 type:complete len:134 (+) Transcript_5975:1-402(+)